VPFPACGTKLGNLQLYTLLQPEPGSGDTVAFLQRRPVSLGGGATIECDFNDRHFLFDRMSCCALRPWPWQLRTAGQVMAL
jgi:hypothetical protein